MATIKARETSEESRGVLHLEAQLVSLFSVSKRKTQCRKLTLWIWLVVCRRTDKVRTMQRLSCTTFYKTRLSRCVIFRICHLQVWHISYTVVLPEYERTPHPLPCVFIIHTNTLPCRAFFVLPPKICPLLFCDCCFPSSRNVQHPDVSYLLSTRMNMPISSPTSLPPRRTWTSSTPVSFMRSVPFPLHSHPHSRAYPRLPPPFPLPPTLFCHQDVPLTHRRRQQGRRRRRK